MLHPTRPPDRRAFLHETARAGLALGALGATPTLALAEGGQSAVAAAVAGKSPDLILHAAMPTEIETPLALLRRHPNLTPVDILFVRNNQKLEGTQTTAVPPPPADGWPIQFKGLVAEPKTVKLAELSRLPTISTEMVLQCSGNGRYFFAKVAPPKAGDKLWQCGALANVRFAGVPLKAVFDAVGLKIRPEAKYATAEGKDDPIDAAKDDFEHSLPLDVLLKRSILALKLNDQPLPAVHGGPVRLITPGFYGTMQVKWLSALRFEAAESKNHHHEGRYRTPKEPLKPGAPFNYTLENSESNWDMRIKSILWQPLDGETVKADAPTTFSGVAWNDGACRIDAVELSLDDGQTWRRTRLERPASPYAWHVWSAVAALPRGKHRALVRAIDALGRSQPLDGAIGWNPSGYAWHGVHAITVTAT